MTPGGRIFLDANAQVPTRPVAREALAQALDTPGNPSSPHSRGRAARRLVDQARAGVAEATGFAPREVFFCSGASEANRWLADAVAGSGITRVVSTPLEHPSLKKPLEQHAARGAIELTLLGVDDRGLALDAQTLANAQAVFCTSAHNETGLLPDLDGLAQLIDDDCLLCTDAAQSLARTGPVHPRADAFSASAHKVGGISGSGALGLRRRAEALPVPWSGGGQEKGVRPGTEAKEILAAFGAACADIEAFRDEHRALAAARDHLEQTLCAAFDHVRVVGGGGPRLSQTTALCFAGADGEALRMALDLAGLDVGFGSACSALAVEPSESLMALGLSRDEAKATVRLSLAPPFGVDEARAAAARLVETLGPVIGQEGKTS